MPGPFIELLVNDSRTEMRREGFGLTRSAAAFTPAIFDPSYKNGGALPDGRYVKGEWATKGVWRVPETGTLIMRPSVLRSDFVTSALFNNGRLTASDLVLAADGFLEASLGVGLNPGAFLSLKRASSSTPLTSISVTPDLTAALSALEYDGLAWAMQTKNALLVNEGWGAFVVPMGLAADRADAYLGFAWAQRYLLVLLMNGEAMLLENSGTQAAPTWVDRAKFSYAQGGVDHTQPFQLAVIPWGIDTISFVFSQTSSKSKPAASNYDTSSESTFLYRVSSSSATGKEPPWDDTIKQYVKAPMGKLTVAVQSESYAYTLALHRIRYDSVGRFTLAAEILDEPKPSASPIVDVIGYFGQIGTDGGQAAAAVVAYTRDMSELSNATLDAGTNQWTAANDRYLVTRCKLTPGKALVPAVPPGLPAQENVYTPEVWALQMTVPPELYVTGTTPVDYSDAWVSLRLRMSRALEPSVLSMRLNRDDDYENLLKQDAGVKLSIDGAAFWHGYFIHQRPVTEGTTPLITDDCEAVSRWANLEDTGLAHFASITRKAIFNVLHGAIVRAGMTASLKAGSEALNLLEVDGFREANDFKSPSEDTTAADLVRYVAEQYGMQGCDDILVVEDPATLDWVVSLSAPYGFDPEDPDDADLPQIKMLLSREFAPESGGVPLTDEERWAGDVAGTKYLLIHSQPEFAIRRPRFNSLRCYGASGTGGGADAMACFIAARTADVEDGASADFHGRVRAQTFGPPETSIASTLAELERIARRRYDVDGKTERTVVLDGEWQPFMLPNVDVWITGPAPYDLATGALKGEEVSYGAWRVEEIDAHIFADDKSGALTSRRNLWTAQYTLSYRGHAFTDTIPMFTTVLPA